MNSGEIINTVGKRVGKINRLAQTVAEGFAMEDIRLFRIEIKKLRAFLRLCRAAGIGHLRLPPSIEAFYSATGAIRDLQLQMQRTADFFSGAPDPPGCYIRFLERELEARKKDAAAARLAPSATGETDSAEDTDNAGDAAKREENGLDIPAGDRERPGHEGDPFGEGWIDKAAIRKYAQDKRQLLTKALKKEPEDVALHRLRKILKDIRYNQQIIESVWKRPLPGLPELEALREMTSLLGAHQDLAVALQHTRVEFTDSLSQAERRSLDKMRRWLCGEKARIHREISVKLDRLRSRLE